MTTLFAQPYDISATGFHFETVEDYDRNAAAKTNDFGQPVEEYEIQFIDGDDLDCAMASAWELNQVSFPAYLDAVDAWDDQEKTVFIIAVSECGLDRDQVIDNPMAADIDLHRIDSLRDLAEEFVEEGLYGNIPEPLQYYIDYDAIARDLSVDYSETVVAGERYVYTCR